MHAAVVRAFGSPPRYEEVEAPSATGDHELVVDVLAAALHPRVRSGASGSHYTSTEELPLTPGIDGVGRTREGELVYFVLPDTTRGSFAEQAVVDRRRCAPLPDNVDPVVLAAAMNPAMASWVALRQRISLQPGSAVLVIGATGHAGQMAVQIAHHLGAGYVIAAGRDRERLSKSAADLTVTFDDLSAAADVDVVLDFLWGSVAERAIPELVRARTDRGLSLDWIQIGSVTGPDIRLPSAALRAANLRLMGSGQGSVSTAAIVAELPALAEEIGRGTFTMSPPPQPVPLTDVEAAWDRPDRLVFVP